MNDRSMRFARVPMWVASMQQLSGRALRVYICILAHADRNGFAFPSLATIAEVTGITRHKLPALINELIAAGLLRRQERRDEAGDNTTNLYEVVWMLPQGGAFAEVFPSRGTPVPAEGSTVLPSMGTRGVPTLGNGTDHLRTDQRTLPPTGETRARGGGSRLVTIENYEPSAEVISWARGGYDVAADDPDFISNFRDWCRINKPGLRGPAVASQFRRFVRKEPEIRRRRACANGAEMPAQALNRAVDRDLNFRWPQ